MNKNTHLIWGSAKSRPRPASMSLIDQSYQPFYIALLSIIDANCMQSEKANRHTVKRASGGHSFNPFSTETVLLVGYWSPITYSLLYTLVIYIKH